MANFFFQRSAGLAAIQDLAEMESPTNNISGNIDCTSELEADATMEDASEASGDVDASASLSVDPTLEISIEGTIAGVGTLSSEPSMELGAEGDIDGESDLDSTDITLLGTVAAEGELEATSEIEGTAYFEEELLDGAVESESALEVDAVLDLKGRGAIDSELTLEADPYMFNEGMVSTIAGVATLSVDPIAELSGEGNLSAQSNLSGSASMEIAATGEVRGRSDLYVFPFMRSGDLVTFVRLDDVQPRQVAADGGYPIDLIGEFPLGVPLIVRIGRSVSDDDPAVYSGKVGQGTTIYAVSRTRLRIYSPQLIAGRKYSVTIISPTKRSALSQILEAMPVEHRTGVFSLRSVLPNFWNTGPRNMAALKDTEE